MIPAEAVEAAAKASHVSKLTVERWEDVPGWIRTKRLREARAALEAAAPPLLAEAWDEGQKSGMRHADRLAAAAKIGRPELPGPISPNPYRPTQ